MKVYVAAKFEEKARVRELYALLREHGHTITCDWTTKDEMLDLEGLAEAAKADLEGVRTCDALVCLPHDRGKGLFVEMGLAVALGKDVLVLGTPSEIQAINCIFFYLPAVTWIFSTGELVRMLTPRYTVVRR